VLALSSPDHLLVSTRRELTVVPRPSVSSFADELFSCSHSNCKKQGLLPLWFKDPADYDKISGTDKISILGLDKFAPGKDLDVEITHKDGSKDTVQVSHTFNESQIGFFKAGSALNLMAKAAVERAAAAKA
jgi:aconitase A